METVIRQRESLAVLGKKLPLQQRLDAIYQLVASRHPEIHRMAVALADPISQRLHTYIYCGDAASPLTHYETDMSQAPELALLKQSGESRVIQDLQIYEDGTHAHTLALKKAGYQSSYTIPVFWADRFEAFVFYNSRLKDVFTNPVLGDLDVFGHLAGSLVMAELMAIRTLMAALRTSVRMVHLRDPETGRHLERMGQYTRLIAQNLARSGKYPFDEDFVEHLSAFAPLHDIGKIGIPDEVLMKNAALNLEEFEKMKSHPTLGRSILDSILSEFGLESLEYVDLLRNVAEGHHEMLDGSGYPQGLQNGQVPIAARIIAVADIFDALTSRRPYKEPWPNADAYSYLQRQAAAKLDQDCVDALMLEPLEVRRIQDSFGDLP